jgi:hypothetical protein
VKVTRVWDKDSGDVGVAFDIFNTDARGRSSVSRCAMAACRFAESYAPELSEVEKLQLDPWDLRSIARTAVELFDTYGDRGDVLSTSQVEVLERVRALIGAHA